ncbi:hypothetical protein AKO1_008079 [Acrasis kona]|uniref:Uncharacterized protein n=1 Tax=Acrasis kona TaxID=1008807 RepID=A0AAW2YQN0_9EUKA
MKRLKQWDEQILFGHNRFDKRQRFNNQAVKCTSTSSVMAGCEREQPKTLSPPNKSCCMTIDKSTTTRMIRSNVEVVVVKIQNLSVVEWAKDVRVEILLQGSLLHLDQSESKRRSKVVPNIPPGHSKVVEIPFQMGYDCQFYSKQNYLVELYINDDLIDTKCGDVEVVPCFDCRDTDVCFILCDSPSIDLLPCMNKIFDSLGLYNTNYYDVKYNKEQDQTKSILNGKNNKIIVVYAERISTILSCLSSSDLISHFNPSGCGVLFLAQNIDVSNHQMADYLIRANDKYNDKYKVRDIGNDEFGDLFIFCKPTSEHVACKCREIEEDCSELDSEHNYSVRVNKSQVIQVGKSWISRSFTYGEASLYKIPIAIDQPLHGFKIKPGNLKQLFNSVQSCPMNCKIYPLFRSVVETMTPPERIRSFVLRHQEESVCKLIIDTLYIDIKSELQKKSSSDSKLKGILSECLQHVDHIKLVKDILSIMYRIEADLYWTSWYNSDVKRRRNKLAKIRSGFEKDLRKRAKTYDSKKVINLASKVKRTKTMDSPNTIKFLL